MNQQEYLIKIVNYKGSVVHSWKAPKNRRGCKAQIRKLLRLYWRCKQTNLLTKELFAAIKSYAEALYKLAIEVFIVEPELASLLKEVMSTTIEEFEEEIVAEKMRVHENQKCSFCRTKLVYPAYVVYRKGLEIVKKSDPIGIYCLKSLAGKLNDLVVEIYAQIKDISPVNNNQIDNSLPVTSSIPETHEKNTENLYNLVVGAFLGETELVGSFKELFLNLIKNLIEEDKTITNPTPDNGVIELNKENSSSAITCSSNTYNIDNNNMTLNLF